MYTIDKKDNEAVIHFTLPWDEIKASYEVAIADAAKNVTVKGFRKGHVPKDVAKEQVDRARILSDVVDDALRKEYYAMAQKEDVKLAGAPEVQVKKLAEGNDVEVEMRVALIPEITLPKDWKKIVQKTIKEQASEKKVIDDNDVDREVKHLAESRTEHIPVERAAADGDHVKIDFTVKQDGVVIEGGASKDHSLVLGKGAFIPGFEENVIGMKAGEEKTFDLQFPKDYHAKHLAGKKATFAVKLNAVEERKTPKVDDAFARSTGKDIKDLAMLKKNIREGMEAEQKQQAEESLRTALLDALTQKIDVELPQSMIKEELARMVGEMEQQIQMSGMTFDDYLAKMGKTRDDLEKEWTPQARKRILSALVLEKLGEELEIKPQSDEIEAEMNKTLAMYKGVADIEKQLDMKQLYNYTQGVLRNKKVFEELLKM